MSKFKINDIVRCVDDHLVRTIQHGRTYKVIDTDGLNVVLDNGYGTKYREDRFILVSRLPVLEDVQQEVNVGVKLGIGDVVTRVSGSGIRVGAELSVIAAHSSGGMIRVDGDGDRVQWRDVNCFALVRKAAQNELDQKLSEAEVAQALLSGVKLQYFHNESWQDVARPEVISINFIKTGTFRYARYDIDYYGNKIPKPLEVYPTSGVVFGISINKRTVYKCSVHQRMKTANHWSTGEEAHAALVVMLKPFGIVPEPLEFKLSKDYIA